MFEDKRHSAMILFTALVLTTFVSITTSIKVLVERGKTYDQIIWDGDCSKINGSQAVFNGKKICACRRLGLYGTIFPNDDGFVTCLYGHSKTGASVFLWPEYSTAIHAIDNNSFHKQHGVSNDAAIRSNTLFNLSTELSFKMLRLYTFIAEDPFNKIPNRSIFCLVNEKTGTNRQKYNFQVHTKVTEELRGQLMQVQLYSKDKHLNQKTYVGFTVVKFIGDRYYNLQIPIISTSTSTFASSTSTKTMKNSSAVKISTDVTSSFSTLKKSTETPKTSPKSKEAKQEEKYKIVTVVLATIAAIFLIIIVVLIATRRRKEKKDHEVTTSRDGVAVVFNNDTLGSYQQSIHEYNNLEEKVEYNNYQNLNPSSTNNCNYPNNMKKDDNIYANYYDPVDLQRHDHHTVTSYYNDDNQRYYNGDNERFYYVDNNMCH